MLAPDEAPRAADASSSDEGSDTPASPSSSTSGFVAARMHSPSSLQLYRLYLPAGASAPKLTYVRSLHGQLGPVTALALADGRCVSLGVDGSVWVWDLERGWGTEVQAPRSTAGVSPVLMDGEEELDGGAIEETDAIEDLPMGTPLGAVAFDERRIVTAGAFGIEARRFDI